MDALLRKADKNTRRQITEITDAKFAIQCGNQKYYNINVIPTDILKRKQPHPKKPTYWCIDLKCVDYTKHKTKSNIEQKQINNIRTFIHTKITRKMPQCSM